MAKLFDNTHNDYTGNVTISNEDVIDGITEATEASVAYAEACEKIDTYVSALENRDVLETIIERQEEILENGKADTASAAMSQVALESICVTLGASPDVYHISTESMVDTPAIAMQASLESSKSVLEKVLDALKAFVAKIIQFVRKATLKVVTAVSRVEKSAKAFKETLNKSDKTGTLNDGVNGYPEGIAKGIKTKFGTFIASGLGFSEKTFVVINGDLSNVKGNLESLGKVTKDKLTDGSTKDLLAIKDKGKIYEILSKPNDFFTNFPNDYNDGTVSKFITRYDGTMFRVALFKTETKDGQTTTKSTYFEGTIKPDLIKNYKLDKVIPYNKLESIADVAEKLAKELKDVVKAGDSALDNVKKVVDDAKSDIDKATKDAVEAAEKDDATAETKEKAKTAKAEAKKKLSAIDSFAHVVPKAVLDTAWMHYRVSASTLWVAQKTYGLYK